jgi:hypothetical protein
MTACRPRAGFAGPTALFTTELRGREPGGGLALLPLMQRCRDGFSQTRSKTVDDTAVRILPNRVVASAANLRRAGDERRLETFGAFWFCAVI